MNSELLLGSVGKTAAMAACLQTFVARWLPPRHAHSGQCGDTGNGRIPLSSVQDDKTTCLKQVHFTDSRMRSPFLIALVGTTRYFTATTRLHQCTTAPTVVPRTR